MKFTHEASVRFRDLDVMGHAHHTIPLILFEEARAAYWRTVANRPGLQDIDYLLAEIRVQFKQRINYPATLIVHAAVTHLGNASFTMTYRLVDQEGAVLATGESVQVMFDYASGRSMRMPEETRSSIESYEGLNA